VDRSENLCELLVKTRDVLGYVQLADFPCRREPGTGELDFPQLFATLDAIGYRDALGMEHGKSRPGRKGERAVIVAYRSLGQIGSPGGPRSPQTDLGGWTFYCPKPASRAAACQRATS
jgi:hypothetical protein